MPFTITLTSDISTDATLILRAEGCLGIDKLCAGGGVTNENVKAVVGAQTAKSSEETDAKLGTMFRNYNITRRDE